MHRNVFLATVCLLVFAAFAKVCLIALQPVNLETVINDDKERQNFDSGSKECLNPSSPITVSSSATANPKSNDAPAKIVMIRHGEKVDIPSEIKAGLSFSEHSHLGLSMPLSVKGQERANALAVAFSQNRMYENGITEPQKELIERIYSKISGNLKGNLQKAYGLNPLFATPDVIFATGPTIDQEDSQTIHYVRAYQTVKPLADTLRLEVNTKYTLSLKKSSQESLAASLEHYRQFIDEVMHDYPGKVVLICWEHLTLADFAKILNAPDNVFQKLLNWPDDVYDQVWVFSYNPNGSIDYIENFSQKLLEGDCMQEPQRYYPEGAELQQAV